MASPGSPPSLPVSPGRHRGNASWNVLLGYVPPASSNVVRQIIRGTALGTECMKGEGSVMRQVEHPEKWISCHCSWGACFLGSKNREEQPHKPWSIDMEFLVY